MSTVPVPVAGADARSLFSTRLPLLVYAGVFLFLVLKPFYLWSSGYPQISDMVLVLTMIRVLLWKSGRLSYTREEFPIVAFSVTFAYYASLVNLVALVLIAGESDFMRTSLFYVYNAMALMLFVYLLHHDSRGTAVTIVAGVFAGLVVEFALVAAQGGLGGDRATGTFNNPNQLGYYVVLSGAILVTAIRSASTRTVITVAGLLMCVVLAAASLSKAAIGAIVLLLVGLVLVGVPGVGRLSRRVRFSVIGVLGGVTLLALQENVRNLVLVRSVVERFQAQENDSSLAARGYDRLLEYPEYWLFGAGEGANERFESNTEFHSLLGNVQLSYGLVGLLLVLAVLYIAVRRSGITGLYVMGAVMFYGLTHNGIRNTMLWILIAMLAFAVPRARAAGVDGAARADGAAETDGVRATAEGAGGDPARDRAGLSHLRRPGWLASRLR